MAKQGGADQFANLAVITITESAANTLTFKKLETGISLFEKVAWIIHRIEWFTTYGATIFDGTGDSLSLALTSTDQLTSIPATNAAVLELMQIQRADFGATATSLRDNRPFMKDFSSLPGGGIIVPPNPLYAGAVGSGLASATTSYLRIYYTNKQLAPDEYWELVEARRLISS